MIPRIQTGSSFEGAGLYYLHDKRLEGERERLTTGRVAWTHALNTLEQEPEGVLAEMRQTARDQALLKHLSGNRPDGRPTEITVMTVALAWSPEQSPSKQDMIEAGQSFLKHMGWQEHQVLFVAHNDTKHPHVHLIINRIHPGTGMTLDANWSKIRCQRWALDYEREHGRIFCEAREAKYGASRDIETSHMNYRDWRAWHEAAKDKAIDPEHHRALEAGEWTVLKQSQRQDRIAFWNETGRMRKELRATLRAEVREEFSAEWQAYALHKQERLEKAQLYDREARSAMRKHHREGGAKAVAAVAKIRERQGAYHTRLRDDLAEMRADISTRQGERLEALAGPGLELLSKERSAAYKEVLASHREENAELRDNQRDGIRRYDLLDRYTRHAKGQQTAKDEKTHHEKPRREGTAADSRRQSGRDPLLTRQWSAAGKEVTPASREKAPRRDATDLAAGALGAVGKIADAVESLLMPPSPKEQKAAKARAIRKEQIARDNPPPEFSAERAVAAEREQKAKAETQDAEYQRDLEALRRIRRGDRDRDAREPDGGRERGR